MSIRYSVIRVYLRSFAAYIQNSQSGHLRYASIVVLISLC